METQTTNSSQPAGQSSNEPSKTDAPAAATTAAEPTATNTTTEPAKTDAPVTPPAKTEEKKPEEKPAETQAASEEEYDIELSENSPLSEKELNEIAEEASRLNLSKEDAQKLVAWREEAYKNGETKAREEFNNQIAAYRAEFEKSPDFSTDPAVADPEKVKANWETVGLAIQKFGTPELMKALNTPGVGDNIEVARMLLKVGGAVKAMQPELPGGKLRIPSIQQEQDERTAMLKRQYPEHFK